MADQAGAATDGRGRPILQMTLTGEFRFLQPQRHEVPELDRL